MAAAKPVAKKFAAVLERTPDRLRWVIARMPFDSAKFWGRRGQLRVQGEINGFPFRSTLFPDGNGRHFLIVNKKLLSGGKTAPGLTANFLLQPDSTPQIAAKEPTELLRELGQSKRLSKFYESINASRRREICKWVGASKHSETRRRRSQQITVRLMETMEAERDLPPMMQLAFRQNPRAQEAWDGMSPAHRRSHLFSVFYYRNPEARARRIAKCMEDLLGVREKASKKKSLDEDTRHQEELE
jgi:uncharacterized protein YdeI (YjbR/CyaY-like superfamily)